MSQLQCEAVRPGGTTRGERALGTPLATFPFDLQSRLIDATSVQDVYELGIAMLARIPATIAIRIFQRDDRGDLVLVQAWQSPLVNETSATPDELSKAVHKRWIAAHRVGHNTLEFARPFYLQNHPRWLVVPMLASDELIGAIAAERRLHQPRPASPGVYRRSSCEIEPICSAMPTRGLRSSTRSDEKLDASSTTMSCRTLPIST
jgi:hypothetical protein